jgi:hypothetical protein
LSLRSQRLNDPKERSLPLALLHEPHVAPLTEFVERLRRETGLHQESPFLDPPNGGVNARCLFVAEAPGPRAVLSGFVSRDNPNDGLPSPPAGEYMMLVIHAANDYHSPHE